MARTFLELITVPLLARAGIGHMFQKTVTNTLHQGKMTGSSQVIVTINLQIRRLHLYYYKICEGLICFIIDMVAQIYTFTI